MVFVYIVSSVKISCLFDRLIVYYSNNLSVSLKTFRTYVQITRFGGIKRCPRTPELACTHNYFLHRCTPGTILHKTYQKGNCSFPPKGKPLLTGDRILNKFSSGATKIYSIPEYYYSSSCFYRWHQHECSSDQMEYVVA